MKEIFNRERYLREQRNKMARDIDKRVNALLKVRRLIEIEHQMMLLSKEKDELTRANEVITIPNLTT